MRRAATCLAAILVCAGAATARGQYAAPQAQMTTYAAPPAGGQVVLIGATAPQAVQVVTVQQPCLLDRCLARIGERLAARGQARIVIRTQAAPPPPPQVYVVPASAVPAAAVPVASPQGYGYYQPPPPPPTYAAPQATHAAPPRAPSPAAEAAPEAPAVPPPANGRTS